MGKNNGSNPLINRIMQAQSQQQNLMQQMMLAIPGEQVQITMEGIISLHTPEGEVKLIKQMLAFNSGPAMALYDLDMAEAIANSLLEKVREARSGIIRAQGGLAGAS